MFTFLLYLTASTDTLSEESTCHNLSAKEVYSATDNLSASNFIGQSIAGENLPVVYVSSSLFLILDKLLNIR